MSWLARSLANSLNPDHRVAGDEDADAADAGSAEMEKEDDPSRDSEGSIEAEDLNRGVKEDLSELRHTLTRQFWGVASFLAPQPTPPSIISDSNSSPQAAGAPIDVDVSGDSEPHETPTIGAIRRDFSEFGGRFRTGISRLSKNAAVSEISKIASTFLPFRAEEAGEALKEGESEGKASVTAVGVTEEVLSFARNISMHPETWLDFPLFHDFEDCDDFDMSDTQEDHALAVERLAPRLGALRFELCPSHMSEDCFWKIYFVLLHSRLNKHDAELLLTPQIVEAKAMLLQRLQNQRKPESVSATQYATAYRTVDPTPLTNEFTTSTTLYETTPATYFEKEKHPVAISTEMRVVDKSVIDEDPVQVKSKVFDSDFSIPKYGEDDNDEDGDDWLKETGESSASWGAGVAPLNDEDVSFSDLEEDDDQSTHTVTKRVNADTVPQGMSSRGLESSGDVYKDVNIV